MINLLKNVIDTVRCMIIALIEFDYEKSLEEMKKND
jgi:hypothetical protein